MNINSFLSMRSACSCLGFCSAVSCLVHYACETWGICHWKRHFQPTECGDIYHMWSSEGRALPELTRTPADPDAMADNLKQRPQHRLDTARDHITLSSQNKLRSWKNSKRYGKECYWRFFARKSLPEIPFHEPLTCLDFYLATSTNGYAANMNLSTQPENQRDRW